LENVTRYSYTTLIDGSEKGAKDFQVSKELVTLLTTANASGDFHLPLVVIHQHIYQSSIIEAL